MPLPEEREPPDRPRQVTNDPRAGLENSGRPCPPGGCTGVRVPLIPIITTVADGIGHALKRKHPGKRIPIPLD